MNALDVMCESLDESSNSPVVMPKFRGKIAREIYRCTKGVVMTGSLIKPVSYALAQIPLELSSGFVYSAVGQVGNYCVGYVSGLGVLHSCYKLAKPKKIKATARLCYNVAGLPMTIYAKGVGGAFDGVGLSKLETLWFGTPVYVFDDNRLWIEKNFTMDKLFETASE